MKIVRNKQGFTLIELLAVIVILAIIILVAASNIGAMTTTARKNVLAVEGNTLVNSAKTAYQVDMLNGKITIQKKVCFPLSYLVDNGYFDKNGSYTGSVLVTETGSDGAESGEGKYSYKFWISNGSYKTKGDDGADMGANGKQIERGATAKDNCNGQGVLITTLP